jgi:hypothetical protein
MRRIALMALVIGFLAPFLASAPAHAQASRTWVSGVGDDVNPCSRTAPCKTFAGAISKTAAGGEINCLDPGGFGTVTITKAMTLNCIATLGSVLASGVPGITINAAAADRITLRGLQLQGINQSPQVAGTIGVRILSAALVSIEDTVIQGFAQQGVIDTRSAGNVKLFIRNSVISNNTGNGVSATATGVNNNTEIDNVSSINNLFGVAAATGNNVQIRRSVLSGNGTAIAADSGSNVDVDNSAITGNGTGPSATGNIRISNSDVSFNAAGGVFQSYGNNRIAGNGTVPTITAVSPGLQ